MRSYTEEKALFVLCCVIEQRPEKVLGIGGAGDDGAGAGGAVSPSAASTSAVRRCRRKSNTSGRPPPVC